MFYTKTQLLEKIQVISPSTFDRYVKKGLLPPKVPGTNVWSAEVFDNWSPTHSSVADVVQPDLSVYDKWKLAQAAHENKPARRKRNQSQVH